MEITIIVLFVLYIYKLLRNFRKRKSELFDAEQELFQNTKNILGENDLITLKSKKLWIGMPEFLIYYVCGKPIEIKKRESAHNIEKTWCYNQIPNARSNAREKYHLEIYTYNSFVNNWKKI